MQTYVLTQEEGAARLSAASYQFKKVTFSIFLLMLLSLVLEVVLTLIAQLIPGLSGLTASTDRMMLLTYLGMYLVAAPIYLVRMKKLLGCAPEEHALGAGRFFRILIMCFPLLIAGNLIGTFLSMAFSGGTAENPLASLDLESSPIAMILTAVVAPVMEELLFRKAILDRTRQFGERSAIIFSAVIFGLYHGNLFQFFYAFAVGVLFAYVYLRTGRLRYSIAMHMCINTFAGVLPAILFREGSAAARALEAAESGALADPAAIESLAAELGPGILAGGAFLLAEYGLGVAGIVLLCIHARKAYLAPAPLELPRRGRFRAIYVHAGMILFLLICIVMFASMLLMNNLNLSA